MAFFLGLWEGGIGFGGIPKAGIAPFPIDFPTREIQKKIGTESGEEGMNGEIRLDAVEAFLPSHKAEIPLVWDKGRGIGGREITGFGDS